MWEDPWAPLRKAVGKQEEPEESLKQEPADGVIRIQEGASIADVLTAAMQVR